MTHGSTKHGSTKHGSTKHGGTKHGGTVGEPSDFAGLPGVALVTGGSGGLGAEICALLAARGSDVWFTFRANRHAAAVTEERIAGAGRVARPMAVDLGDAASVAAIVAEAGVAGIHTLIHAAGPVVPQRHLSTVDPTRLRAQIDLEVAGFFNVVQPALVHLREARGSIVAVTTAATHRYPVRDGLSAAAKGAVEQLIRGLAAEEGRFGVRANSVGPGMTTAGMAGTLTASGDLSEKDFAAATANIPLRRFGSARDIAEAVCFLASARAGYISGQHLAVDGGYSV